MQNPFIKLAVLAFALAACSRADQQIAHPESPRALRLHVDGARFASSAGRTFYVHGVNLPWLDGHYGSYLAPSRVHPEWGVQYRHEIMERRLRQIQSLHVNVVRLFLFNDMQGIQVDRAGDITGLDAIFFANLDDTVAIASALSQKLYLVILDGVRDHPELVIERELLLNPDRRRQFEDAVVRTLAKRYRGHEAVFAFDVLNESNHEVDGPVGWEEVRRLARDTASAIHAEDPGRLVSCSLIKANEKNLSLLRDVYADLGLDFYDLHQYGDVPDLPVVATRELRKPIILGEYGQSEHAGEAQQAAATARFLQQARSRGWAGALHWAFDFPGSRKEHRLMNADGSWREAATILRRFGEDLEAGSLPQ